MVQQKEKAHKQIIEEQNRVDRYKKMETEATKQVLESMAKERQIKCGEELRQPKQDMIVDSPPKRLSLDGNVKLKGKDPPKRGNSADLDVPSSSYIPKNINQKS